MTRGKLSREAVYSKAHFPEKPSTTALEFTQKNKTHRDAADWRLREREDAYGSLFQKLFPKDKGNIVLTRLLSEQAVKLDMLLRELVTRGKAASIEEAFSILEKTNPEALNPSKKERISKEEEVRGDVLKAAFAIWNKKWEKASVIIQRTEKKLEKDEKRDLIPIFREELTPIIRDALGKLLEGNDKESGRDFRGAIFWLFNIAGLNGLNLGDLPKQTAQSQELLKEIRTDYVRATKNPFYFAALRRGWKNFGVDTKNVERDPAVVAHAKEYLISQFGSGRYSILYETAKKQLLKHGILTKEEIEQLRRSEIAPRALKHLLEQFSDGAYPILYQSTRDDYHYYGVLTRGEIEQHRRQEILPRAKKRLIARIGTRYSILYTSTRDEYVSYGILTALEAESINKSPEVQKYLRKGI